MIRSVARAGLVVGLATAAACSPPPNILPTNDFNRPTDIGFMCLGEVSTDPNNPADAGGPVQLSGQPMKVCHPPGAANDLGASPQARTFAFMTNSGSDDLSVVDADNWRIIDLDPETGLYGRLPLGTLPEQLSVTDDGCRLVTANRGSCDFSLVDPSVLLAPTFQAQYGGLGPTLPSQTTARQQIVPRKGDGTLLDAEPYEVVFLPEDTSTTPAICPTGGITPSKPWRALATFPSCDLIALIDFPSGNIVESFQVQDDAGAVKLVPTGTSPVCPSECGAGRALPDGGVAPSATPASARYRPSGIAIVPGLPSERRAYVSLASFHYVVSMGLGPDDTFDLSSQNAIVLNDVDPSVGSTRIRLSTEPYKYGNSTVPGVFAYLDHPRRYLYVILGDGTLRVVDVHVPGKVVNGQGEQECETNVDPFKVPSPPDFCTPYDPSLRRPLLVGAGPGIRFPSIPVDVAAADIRPKVNTTDEDHSEATVSGAYAWVLTISGNVYLVNIDPVLRSITTVVQNPASPDPTDPTQSDKSSNGPFVTLTAAEPPPYPNTLRDRNVLTFSTDLDSTSGQPRVLVPPLTLVTGPYVESFWANGTRNNAFAVASAPAGVESKQFLQTPVYFQDPSAVTPQTWSVTWEGPLIPGRYSGKLLTGGELFDPGAGFCGSGVQRGDLLTFTGCTNDNECLPGYKCHIDPTVDQAAGDLPVTGLCVTPSDEASRTAACPEAFQSLRRYEITSAGPDTLELAPHLDELVFSSLTTCEELNASPNAGATDGGASDGGVADGGPDGGAGGSVDGGSDGGAGGSAEAGSPSPQPTDHRDCEDPNDPTTKDFTCWQHPDEPGRNRCLRRCDSNSDCRAGRICLSNGTRGHFCADGPYLAVPSNAQTSCTNPQAVLDQLVTYKVNAGASYLVTGNATGMLAANTTNSSKLCVPFAADQRDWRLIGRIPIARTVDANGEVIDPTTCSILDNRDDNTNPPPISSDSANEDSEKRLKPLRALATNLPGNPCLFTGGRAPADLDPAARHSRAFFENTEISFVLADVDRAPTAPLTITFDVSGGARPQLVIYPATVEVSEAARIVLGPIDSLPQTTDPKPSYEAPYLFVVDQRRLGHAQGGGPTRGQLVRINPVGFSVTIGTAPAGLQPVYEDYTRSGNLFPIQ